MTLLCILCLKKHVNIKKERSQASIALVQILTFVEIQAYQFIVTLIFSNSSSKSCYNSLLPWCYSFNIPTLRFCACEFMEKPSHLTILPHLHVKATQPPRCPAQMPETWLSEYMYQARESHQVSGDVPTAIILIIKSLCFFEDYKHTETIIYTRVTNFEHRPTHVYVTVFELPIRAERETFTHGAIRLNPIIGIFVYYN